MGYSPNIGEKEVVLFGHSLIKSYYTIMDFDNNKLALSGLRTKLVSEEPK